MLKMAHEISYKNCFNIVFECLKKTCNLKYMSFNLTKKDQD